MAEEQSVRRWFIDLSWLEQNNRSFFVLAKGCLCPQCRERLGGKEEEISVAELMANIRDCCSKVPGFITEKTPILESVFRLFLAIGNQPLDLKGLGKQLVERRGGAPQSTSVEVLSRLLRNERYYGIRQVA